jgi:hypothetical protein
MIPRKWGIQLKLGISHDVKSSSWTINMEQSRKNWDNGWFQEKPYQEKMN